MHILLTTYGLLLIFALYCSAQWRSAIDMAFMDAVAIERFAEFRRKSLGEVNNASKIIRDNYNKEHRPTPNSKAVSSKVDSTQQASQNALITDEEDDEEAPIEPPDEEEEETPKQKKQSAERCTSHLHIGALFTGDELSIAEGPGLAAYTLLKNLMIAMYGDQKFYKEAKDLRPEFEEEFIKNLFERSKDEQESKQWISEVSHLGSIELDDDLQSYIRYKMFTGNKSRYVTGSQDDPGYYPLIEFTSLKKRKTLMSLWLAPKPLLMALFNDPEIVQDVIDTRREMYNEIRNDTNESAKQTKTQELRLRFGAYIQDLAPYIDFQVTKTRPPDLSSTQKKKKK